MAIDGIKNNVKRRILPTCKYNLRQHLKPSSDTGAQLVIHRSLAFRSDDSDMEILLASSPAEGDITQYSGGNSLSQDRNPTCCEYLSGTSSLQCHLDRQSKCPQRAQPLLVTAAPPALPGIIIALLEQREEEWAANRRTV
ncbi:hypothetical protein PCH_Pc12g07970 [Penicillium rubens Wisconsin 54-1255]|uniref:Uncharacterized protein n=1 Tax=Penicillium rubens (strain ATCC 28089 / DSM 1075 / NRRL 1951 / Wisconsin 54-1255) TaxID=500485 RepID=B6GXM8_PENRW|nr:hypothetical protein PCH_Pc12g07970 [Penicillium rubens Wisconsin 54-1255]